MNLGWLVSLAFLYSLFPEKETLLQVCPKHWKEVQTVISPDKINHWLISSFVTGHLWLKSISLTCRTLQQQWILICMHCFNDFIQKNLDWIIYESFPFACMPYWWCRDIVGVAVVLDTSVFTALRMCSTRVTHCQWIRSRTLGPWLQKMVSVRRNSVPG